VKLETLNNWLTFLANLAVFAGIVFLALEINQNSQLMQIQIQQSRAEAAIANLTEEYNSPYIPEIRVKLDNGEDLTQVEARRYREWFRSVNRNQENILLQFNAGMLFENPSVRQFAEEVIASTPYNRSTWNRIKRGFATDYVELVESIIAESGR
jgi:hypothetical protein